MDEELIKAAEREMRRNAPEERPVKKQRTQEQDSHQEVGRFDYQAVDSLSLGCQGFLLTCAFRREKSATREGSAILKEVIASMAEASNGEDAANFSIIKLASRGLVLLSWERAAEALRPTAVVSELIKSVQEKRRQRLKFVQRVMPVEAMCELEEAALRTAVAQLAAEHAASLESQPAAGASGGGSTGAAELPVLRFAASWRSRHPEQAPAAGASSERSDAPQRSAADEALSTSRNAETGVCTENCGGGGGSVGRKEALTAAATGFEEGLAGVRKVVVDLKAPQAVVFIEGVPVGRRILCALSIVGSDLTCMQRKLCIVPVGS